MILVDDIEKIILNKNVVDDVVGINIFFKDGSNRYVTGPEMELVSLDYGLGFLRNVKKSEKAEIVNEKIESIEILERDKFFSPNKIKVRLDNGVVLNIDNNLSLTECLNEYMASLNQNDKKDISKEMDLFDYLISNFAIKRGIELDKLPFEISKNTMLRSMLNNEVLSFVFKRVSANMCNYFIGNLASQENDFILFVEDQKGFFEKYSYNKMIKNFVKYNSIDVLKSDEYGIPLEVEITYESGNRIKVDFKHIVMDFCNEIHSNHNVDISSIFNGWNNPNLNNQNNKSSVVNFNVNQEKISSTSSFSKIIKNMFGFVKKEKNDLLKK